MDSVSCVSFAWYLKIYVQKKKLQHKNSTKSCCIQTKQINQWVEEQPFDYVCFDEFFPSSFKRMTFNLTLKIMY